MYAIMSEVLNENKIGNFELHKFEINDKNRPFRCDIPDGKYIRLLGYGDCVMSDTPMEKRTNREFVKNANGNVFIAGLGLGMIVLPIQEKQEVRSITILEKHAEVIELVGSQLQINDKVKIIHGDVFEYEFEKGTKFDSIYFDIWNYVNSDVWQEMKKLKRKYLKYKNKDNPISFIKCWAEREAKTNSRLW